MTNVEQAERGKALSLAPVYGHRRSGGKAARRSEDVAGKFPQSGGDVLCARRSQGQRALPVAQDGRRLVPISWTEVARRVAALAEALKGLGLKPGDRVMLVSENRPEWCIADLAIMAAGCVTVPTYVTNTERDHTHIVENSGARAAIVSTAKLAQARCCRRSPAPQLRYPDRHGALAARPVGTLRSTTGRLCSMARRPTSPPARPPPPSRARISPASSTPAAPAARRAACASIMARSCTTSRAASRSSPRISGWSDECS
jgi:non-ribosomal peptide synthetase component F